MDLEHVQRLAQAFAQGVAFARGFIEMAQDAKDGEEEGHWVTIGGERGADGEKHGGRPVFISGSGVIKKGLSKSAQGKTLGQVFGKGGEFSSEGGKSKGETARKAGERASTKRAKAETDRKDATSRAKEFRQETKQIVANDLEPSVAKLKKALDANVPASVHDDLVDMHRLADQIGIMANKLCSLNSRWAENSKDPSALVVSSHGQNAKGTAERVAKLARQSAAIAQDFGKPNNERSYPGLYAHDKIRDNLSELRGLHQDLLDHIRRIQEPEKREEPQEDPLYAARGKMINGAGERTRAGKEAGERASTKRAKAETDRRDATSRAKEFRQETKQIVANDLEPSVAKLKKALDANVPASVHDDLVDTHRLADQIGIMANKLCSLNSRYAENSKEPSAFVVSSHGQNAKGTAERVAKLARQSAALAHEFGKPKDERFSYGDAQVASEIRDNLSELRGLHQDLLDHIRRIQEPEKREEPQEDPLYAARGKMINGPAKTNATREPSVSKKVPRSFDLGTKEIKDLTDKLRDYTDDRTGSYEFGRKLQDMANLSAEIDKMDKRYLSSMGQHNLEAARHHLGLAAKAARAVDNYQWRGAISSLRTEITRRLNTANKLYQEAQTEIDSKQRR